MLFRSRQITIKADLTLDQVELDRADMLVLPGGGVGVQKLSQEPTVEKLVREAAKRGIPLAAICAAPTLLGRWGLLEGEETPQRRKMAHYRGGAGPDGLDAGQGERPQMCIRDRPTAS